MWQLQTGGLTVHLIKKAKAQEYRCMGNDLYITENPSSTYFNMLC
jgi:hypothetical protein